MARPDSGLNGLPGQTSGLSLSVVIERWPISGGFTISRGAKQEAVVVVAAISDGVHAGRGELAFQGASTQEIRKEAIKQGMSTLYDDGIRKVLEGTTTIEEVFRVSKRSD